MSSEQSTHHNLLIIIPTYNESLNIEDLINNVFIEQPTANLLFVDDNSPDQTAAIIKRLQSSFPQVHLIERQTKLGLGSAYIEGFKWGLKNKFDPLVQMDADFSHRPEDVQKLLHFPGGAEVTLGSRYLKDSERVNWPFSRFALSYVGGWITKTLTGLPAKDVSSGFKAIRSAALTKIDFSDFVSSGHAFQVELLYRLKHKGVRIHEVPISFHQRRKGQSKLNVKEIYNSLSLLFYLKFKISK